MMVLRPACGIFSGAAAAVSILRTYSGIDLRDCVWFRSNSGWLDDRQLATLGRLVARRRCVIAGVYVLVCLARLRIAD